MHLRSVRGTNVFGIERAVARRYASAQDNLEKGNADMLWPLARALVADIALGLFSLLLPVTLLMDIVSFAQPSVIDVDAGSNHTRLWSVLSAIRNNVVH